jgi:hypothetical protein
MRAGGLSRGDILGEGKESGRESKDLGAAPLAAGTQILQEDLQFGLEDFLFWWHQRPSFLKLSAEQPDVRQEISNELGGFHGLFHSNLHGPAHHLSESSGQE